MSKMLLSGNKRSHGDNNPIPPTDAANGIFVTGRIRFKTSLPVFICRL